VDPGEREKAKELPTPPPRLSQADEERKERVCNAER
jgi:hypothetical protein